MRTQSKIWKSTADKLHAEKLAHNVTQKELDKWKVDYGALVIERNALIATVQELEAQFNKMYREGSLWYYDEDDFIVNAIHVEPYHNHTYPRDIDLSVIHTSAYQKFPYIKTDFTIDSEQYKKYIGGII